MTIIADSGYDGLSSVQINAMPVGTAGAPTATKGTVSNHSISVTPRVTNTTGYIVGGTKGGTAVTVSASELVSGTLSITSSGTTDVTNYANAIVDDANLTAENIKKDVSILGVTGTYEGSGGGYAICTLVSAYHSITTDGSYGPNITTKETRASADDYVYLSRDSDLSPRITNVTTQEEVQRVYYDEYSPNTRGGPVAPGMDTITVWRFVMPASDVIITA
jgi:hypothetical protein